MFVLGKQPLSWMREGLQKDGVGVGLGEQFEASVVEVQELFDSSNAFFL